MADDKRYRVISIHERVAPDGRGGFREEVLVRYETRGGYVGSLTLPKSELSVERVAQALEAEVEQIERIFEL